MLSRNDMYMYLYVCIYVYINMYVCIYTYVYVLSRDGSRRRGGGNDTPSVELKLSSGQKVTVRNDCGSHRCLHLSDLGSPDIGRGRRKWSQMIGGGPQTEVGFPSPQRKKNTKKNSFLDKSRGRRTTAISLRAKDKRLRHERPESLKPALKTVQSLLARERREILQWNPVKKIR